MVKEKTNVRPGDAAEGRAVNGQEEVRNASAKAGKGAGETKDADQGAAGASSAGDADACAGTAVNNGAEAEKTAEDAASSEVNGEAARLAEELEASKDKYIRLAAEFDNYRRRTSKEKLELVQTAGEDIIKGILPVLDDCERALQVLEKSADSEAAKEGTLLIYNKLMNFLKGKGLEAIDAMGKELDTDMHEAVAQFPVEENDRKGRIIDIVQHGYTLHGKVIRFAKVVVGA